MTALLEVKGLTVRYGPSRAVSNVSFAVKAGAVTSLIGSNGAGKTTLLKAVSGLVPAAAGTVSFDGSALLSLPPEARAGLGLAHIPEGRHVFPGMTVFENLRLGAFGRRDAAAVAEDLEAVETMFPRLRERRRQLAGSLSGGEQQMLAVGRALMGRPKLMMMDEPTMGLSPQMIDVILAAIDQLRRRGLTLLIVEQNAVEAIQMADQVYALRLGEIVHQAPGHSFDADTLTTFYLGEG